MVEIGIEYRRFGIKRKAKGFVPEKWSEVTPLQLAALANVSLNTGTPDYRYLAVMTRVKEKILKRLPAFHIYNLAQELRIEERAGNWHDRFILWEIDGFLSPKPKMEGLTFGQFIFADAYYNDWVNKKKDESLIKLISTLYLKPDEKFDHSKIKERYRGFELLLNMGSKIAVVMNWSLINAWLGLAYPLIFQEAGERRTEKGEGKQENGARQSPWIKVFDNLVGDDLINRDKYAELPVHTVLRFMTEKAKERARGR